MLRISELNWYVGKAIIFSLLINALGAYSAHAYSPERVITSEHSLLAELPLFEECLEEYEQGKQYFLEKFFAKEINENFLTKGLEQVQAEDCEYDFTMGATDSALVTTTALRQTLISEFVLEQRYEEIRRTDHPEPTHEALFKHYQRRLKDFDIESDFLATYKYGTEAYYDALEKLDKNYHALAVENKQSYNTGRFIYVPGPDHIYPFSYYNYKLDENRNIVYQDSGDPVVTGGDYEIVLTQYHQTLIEYVDDYRNWNPSILAHDGWLAKRPGQKYGHLRAELDAHYQKLVMGIVREFAHMRGNLDILRPSLDIFWLKQQNRHEKEMQALDDYEAFIETFAVRDIWKAAGIVIAGYGGVAYLAGMAGRAFLGLKVGPLIPQLTRGVFVGANIFCAIFLATVVGSVGLAVKTKYDSREDKEQTLYDFVWTPEAAEAISLATMKSLPVAAFAPALAVGGFQFARHLGSQGVMFVKMTRADLHTANQMGLGKAALIAPKVLLRRFKNSFIRGLRRGDVRRNMVIDFGVGAGSIAVTRHYFSEEPENKLFLYDQNGDIVALNPKAAFAFLRLGAGTVLLGPVFGVKNFYHRFMLYRSGGFAVDRASMYTAPLFLGEGHRISEDHFRSHYLWESTISTMIWEAERSIFKHPALRNLARTIVRNGVTQGARFRKHVRNVQGNIQLGIKGAFLAGKTYPQVMYLNLMDKRDDDQTRLDALVEAYENYLVEQRDRFEDPLQAPADR